MKSLLLIGLMAIVISALGISTLHAEQCGGYTKAETDDTEVAAAANFAMKARESALRKDDKDASVSLVAIVEAAKQVVAGINYKMLLKVNINDKDQLVEVVVWKKLSDDYELCSWKKIDSKKELQKKGAVNE